MCGIFGSFRPSKFEVLDKANQTRGNFASGLIYFDETNFDVFKTEGCFDWDEINLPDGLTYLGHNQAPTSSERIWKEHNSHPFIVKEWVVAHNGVLTNFEKLKADYLPEHENRVDSSIIPALLSHFENDYKDIALIEHVLSLLEGTFGLWIVDTKNLNVYIARQGSTLFYDKNSFSSTKGDNFKEVKEGVIYKFTKKGAKPVGSFKNKSPFLEL
jgi:glucosamine 6-phosphate synthetase-like amidotransferase/phosphosugar isomerase protein